MKKILILFGLGSLLFISSAFVYDNREFEISKNLEIFANLYRELNTNYADDIDPGTLMKTGIDAMVGSLDPFTNFWSESQMEGFKYLTSGKYDGIGATIKTIGDHPTIYETFKGSPALEAGIRIGDKVIEVNGQSAKGKSTEEMRNVLRGVSGTKVLLKIERPGIPGTRDITLTRGELSAPNVPYSGMLRDHVGYISLSTFTNDAGRNMTKSLRNLYTEDPDLKGVIIDLRDNGGGLLREAVHVCNMFIDKGQEVVSTRSKVKTRDRSFKTRSAPVDLNIPVAVMINKNSASASEIVSGVIQDLDRGVLIGQQSYGKGLVQNTYDLGYNSKVKITTSKYYIPSGRCIQSANYVNGEKTYIPDDQRQVFQTKSGRKVLDGGGVQPDIIIKDRRDTKLINDLIKGDYIFNYVTEYCTSVNDSLVAGEFTFNKFNDFIKYLNNSGFSYKTSTEEALETLKAQALEDELQNNIESEIKKLEQGLDKAKKDELSSQSSTITSIIEEEIINRFQYRKGKIQQMLTNDVEIERAIDVLNNTSEYEKILKGN